MAFIHQPRAKPARERQADQSHYDAPYASRPSLTRSSQQSQDQDWSIVFPGRARPSPSQHASQHTPSPDATSACLDPFDSHTTTAAATLTLPPLHDGTGRFLASETESSASASAATRSPISERDHVQGPYSPRSDAYSDSVFSISESQADADEEEGFGSGSGSDFESDVVASAPSQSSFRRNIRRARRASRSSRLSFVSPPASEVDVDVGLSDRDTAQPEPGPGTGAGSGTSTIGDSRAWSWLSGARSRAQMLDQVPESTTPTHLYTPRKMPTTAPVVFTSDSESDGGATQASLDPTLARAQERFESDLASSNLALSAGLERRPKRRHRHSAAGRSSKRSNTSQSQSVVGPGAGADRAGSQRSFAVRSDGNMQVRGRGRRKHASGTRAQSGRSASRQEQEPNVSVTRRAVSRLLRKVFDLEPEVLEAFAHETKSSHFEQLQRHRMPSIGFALEQGVNVVPLPIAMGMGHGMASDSNSTAGLRLLIDGREVEDKDEDLDGDEASGTRTPRGSWTEEKEEEEIDKMLTASPLFDVTKTVKGEETMFAPGDVGGLTEGALSRSRRSGKDSASVLEPTTMEALQALVNSVIPVPMPFRILGALARSLGWQSLWSSGGGGGGGMEGRHETDSIGGGSTASHSSSRSSRSRSRTWTRREGEQGEAGAGAGAGGGFGEVESEQERRYRYERLLSAKQAKEWSRRYRGIQMANSAQDETSLDVPACWGGNEHPALAGEPSCSD